MIKENKMIKHIIIFLILILIILFGFYCEHQFSNFSDFDQTIIINMDEDLQWNNLTEEEEEEEKYYNILD